MNELEKCLGDGHIVKYNLKEELCHGMFVSKLAFELSKELGNDPHFSNEMALAGMYHDIGKLKLNRYIYGESSPLVIEEMKYVRMHSKLSFELLKEQNHSDLVKESVLYHHENYDGSGYPDNLVGEEIPYGARVVRVCDVYAALTSDRPYRKSFSKECAMELMIEEIKNFDLQIFLAFQRLIHEKNFECPKLDL